MANLNKVMLIGRLTRDPEVRMFANGGKVAHFGFAVNNKKKNAQTGQWEDDPVFLDVDAFNRGDFGKKADLVEQYLKKGHQAFIEGHLKLDQWTDKDGQKRSKIKVVLDNIEFLEARGDGPRGGGGGSGYRSQNAPPPSSSDDAGGYDSGPPPDDMPPSRDMPPPPAGRGDEEIPF